MIKLSIQIGGFSVLVSLLISCCQNRKEYYSYPGNDIKKLKYSYDVNTLNGEKCGPYIWFSEKGDTLEFSFYTNDKLNGPSKHYFDGNKLQLMVECSDGLQHGVTKEWYENRQLRIECIYNQNKLWKIICLYDSMGNKLDYGELINGNGFVKNYYPDGKLQFEGNFKNGVRDGYWRFYTNTGLLADSIKYINGYGPESITLENHY